jgi:hypothetical protein
MFVENECKALVTYGQTIMSPIETVKRPYDQNK